MNKPQPQILFIWRAMLSAAAFIAAFLLCVIFRAGSLAWVIAICCLALSFLAAYLVYFPLLYRAISFRINGGNLFYKTGVFIKRETAAPLSSIQYTLVTQSLLARVFGLSSVIIVAAGGRLHIPGLKTAEANRLASALKGE